MASPQAEALANYIKQQLAAGYNEAALRQYLLQYGYKPELVDEAFASLKAPKAIHISPKILIGFGALLSLILLTLLIIFLMGAQKIELSSQSTSTSAQAGSSFNFLLSLGEAKLKSSETISIAILSSSGNIVATSTSVIPAGVSSIPVSINLPSHLPPDSYVVRSTLAVKNKQYKSDLYIDISAPEISEPISPVTSPEPSLPSGTCDDGIQNEDEGGVDCGGSCSPCTECPPSCNDNDACTEEICSFGTNYECVYSPLIPCCGNGICESAESEQSCITDCAGFTPPEVETQLTPQEVIEKVQTEDIDPNEAGGLCNTLNESRDSDKCFDVLASKTENPIFCLYVSSNTTRDSCYMLNFAIKGKGGEDICKNIYNNYLKNNCETLQRIAAEGNIDLEQFSTGNIQNTTLNS